jgi:hypothetical protein
MVMRKLLISTLATLLIATGYATPSFAEPIPDYPGISKLTRGVENSAVKNTVQQRQQQLQNFMKFKVTPMMV